MGPRPGIEHRPPMTARPQFVNEAPHEPRTVSAHGGRVQVAAAASGALADRATGRTASLGGHPHDWQQHHLPAQPRQLDPESVNRRQSGASAPYQFMVTRLPRLPCRLPDSRQPGFSLVHASAAASLRSSEVSAVIPGRQRPYGAGRPATEQVSLTQRRSLRGRGDPHVDHQQSGGYASACSVHFAGESVGDVGRGHD